MGSRRGRGSGVRFPEVYASLPARPVDRPLPAGFPVPEPAFVPVPPAPLRPPAVPCVLPTDSTRRRAPPAAELPAALVWVPAGVAPPASEAPIVGEPVAGPIPPLAKPPPAAPEPPVEENPVPVVDAPRPAPAPPVEENPVPVVDAPRPAPAPPVEENPVPVVDAPRPAPPICPAPLVPGARRGPVSLDCKSPAVRSSSSRCSQWPWQGHGRSRLD